MDRRIKEKNTTHSKETQTSGLVIFNTENIKPSLKTITK